jgi:hypothetical protein
MNKNQTENHVTYNYSLLPCNAKVLEQHGDDKEIQKTKVK